MQTAFSDLEYAAKKKRTRRDQFLADIEAVTPWPALVAAIAPFYPKSEGPGRPTVGLERMLRMYIVQLTSAVRLRRTPRPCSGAATRNSAGSRIAWVRLWVNIVLVTIPPPQ